MVRVEATEPFTLGKFNELKNIRRASIDTPGQLNTGDIFECTNEMYEYLNGKNGKGKVVVKLIEVIPDEVKEEPKVEVKPTIKKTTKKTTKKTSKK